MDTLIANVAKKKGIRTGVVNAAYDLDRKESTVTPASGVTEAFSEEYVTVTVGAGGDYERLHDALHWAMNARIRNGVLLTISMLPGTHYLGLIDTDTKNRRMYNFYNGNVELSGSTGNPADVIVTFDPNETYTGYPFVFYGRGGHNLYLENFTFDPTASGSAVGAKMASLTAIEGGRASLYNIVVKDCYYALYALQGGIIGAYQIFLDNCDTAYLAQDHGRINDSNATVDGCALVYDASSGGQILSSSATLGATTPNGTTSFLTENEVGYDFSCWHNGASALAFKA